MTGLQQTLVITLRTLIGWHFAYEGVFKLILPGWTRAGHAVTDFTAAGYLRAATGPFADFFHALARVPVLMKTIDVLVPIALLFAGVSLMLGLFTQLGCTVALLFLSLFYLSAPPIGGAPQPGAEGTYLFVNKNLIELAAVAVIMAFRTGAIAGLDRLRRKRRPVVAPV